MKYRVMNEKKVQHSFGSTLDDGGMADYLARLNLYYRPMTNRA